MNMFETDRIYSNMYAPTWKIDRTEAMMRKVLQDDVITRLLRGSDVLKKYNDFTPNMVSNVEFFPPAVKMTFEDGTVTTASAQEGDTFDPEMGMMMCINKYIWKGSGYNNFFRKWIKADDNKKAEIQAQKEQTEKARMLAEKRRKKNAERIARKKAAEREEAIQIQAEAYRRAMLPSGNIKEA